MQVLALARGSLILLSLLSFVGCQADDEGKNDAGQDEDAAEAFALTALPVLTPPSVTIKTITVAGDACPQGSTSVNISPDRQAFTTLFADFLIGIEGSTHRRRVKGNCALDLDMTLPAGWQVAVISLDQRGFVDLPKGGKAKLKTTLQFVDKRRKARAKDMIAGPISDNFESHQEFKLKKLRWSPCGGAATLSIGLEAILTVPKQGAAFLAMDSLDGELRQNLALKWQKCK